MSIPVSKLAEMIRKEAIIGTRGPYSAAEHVKPPIFRTSQSFVLYVDGLVQWSNTEPFRLALENVWKETLAGQGK